jgi:hypothetical protein
MADKQYLSKLWFRNLGGFVVKAIPVRHVDNEDVSLKSKTITLSDSYELIDLPALGVLPGDEFSVRFKVVAGKGKTTEERYIFDPVSGCDASYEMTGTTLSNKLVLCKGPFVGGTATRSKYQAKGSLRS